MAAISINTTKDTYIMNNDVGNNFGDRTTVHSDKYRTSLFGFDITSAPASSHVSDAVVYLFTQVSGCGMATIFKRITGSWAEMTVTYNTRPAVTVTNQYNHNLSNSVGWTSYDVTNIYKDAKDAGNEFGIQISSSAIFTHYIESKEHAYSREAFIHITTPPDDYYVKTGGNDTLDGSSWANAWATVNKAATTVTDGNTIHIEHGTYNAEPATNKIAPQNAGASGIKYQIHTTGGGTGTATVIVEKN
jgi:hypothetical protein